MNQIILKKLMDEQDYPCISVLLPTYRTAPEYHKNEKVLKKLVKDAEERLFKEMSKREAVPYIEKLKQLVSQVDISHTKEGLALFVSNNFTEKVDLPFAVKQRVVIDKTFATRDIIMTVNRAIKYHALLLSIDKVRLLQCIRDEAVEIESNGFPKYSNLEFFDLNPSDLSRDKEKVVKDFFRKVSKSLQDFFNDEKQNLVLLGVEKNIGFFREVTGLNEQIIACFEGSYTDDSVHDIGKKVWPVIKSKMSKKRNSVIKNLEDAVNAGKYVSEISEVWRFANEGRIRTLIAEENYSQPCKLNEDRTISLIDNPEKGMIDDAVDEIAEIVINKGGNVVFVDDGLLKNYKRIAAILRY